MESDEDRASIREALRAADRAEAAPWTDFPPTPWWYPFAVAVWAALLTLALTELGDGARSVASLALITVELVFLRWYLRYRRGVLPTGPAPREFRRAIGLFLTGALGIVATVAVTVDLLDAWAGATVALLATPVLLTWYERAYTDAARRARERLA